MPTSVATRSAVARRSTAQQNRPDAHGLEIDDRLPRGRSNRIGDADHAEQLRVGGDVDQRSAGGSQALCGITEHARLHTGFTHQGRVAHQHRLISDHPAKPLSSEIRDLIALGNGHPMCFRSGDDGQRQRMGGIARESSGGAEDVVVRHTGDRNDVGHRRPSLGERPGLVEDHSLDPAHTLQSRGVLDENVVPCAESGAHGYCGGSGQPQRVRTGDHHCGDGEGQGREEGCSCEHRPADEGQHACAHRDDHQHRRRPISQPLPGRLRVLRLRDQRGDLGQDGVISPPWSPAS
jgi:hypothetical protein